MMYNPYMAMMGQYQHQSHPGGGGGFPGMNPMAAYGNPMAGQQQQMPMQMQGGQMSMMQQPASGGGDSISDQSELKPFDSTQMKRGRMGHYGYLEGRGESQSRSLGICELIPAL